MRRRRVRSVGQLLQRAFAALVALLTLSGVVAVATTQRQYDTVSELSEKVLPTRLANTHLRVVLTDAQRSVRGYLLTGDGTFHTAYEAAVSEYPKAVAELRALAGPHDLYTIHRMEQRADSWFDIAERQDRAPPRSDLAVLLVERGKAMFDAFLNDNSAYDRVLGARAAILRTRAQRAHQDALMSLIAFTLVGVLLALMTAVRTTRRINLPLAALVTTLARLGRGEHEARVAEQSGPLEVRKVGHAVNRMADEVGAARLAQEALFSREQQLVAELRELDRAKTEFLSTVSHELRTPLTSISGYAELLRDEDVGPIVPAQDRMLETIERNTARLRNLIEDLLALAKVEEGSFRAMRSPADMRDLVESAVEVVQPSARDRIVLSVEYTGNDFTAAVDRHQIDRLLMNLLSNAVKFTPIGGRVSVSLADAGTELVLVVADTGIGIPPEDQKSLFTRFFRASNAVEQAIPGTGLGLTLVRTIVANHQGQLHIQSRPNEGTTITVRLPKADRAPAQLATAAPESASVAESSRG